NILNVNAFAATNKIIIPAQADLYSLQGIFQLYSTIEMVRKYCNPSLDILGILLTRYNARSIITKSMTQNMQEMAKAIGTKLL
ncbi:ParA family protein, partial [Escherichia coli]|uniref:ParA family protein n=1 Tax=Escherichia coli TaxID=562 RepID=UPI001F2FA825